MGPFGGSTHHYAPVDLNSLLYRYETDLHDFAVQLGLTADAQRWAAAAAARHAAIDKYLWRPERGLYMDYDFVAADGTIREKYNMASGNADVTIRAGYKANVIGFGWTNGVYLKMQQVLHEPHDGH
ncbi:MAG: trehalase family glycosidase [Rhodanobacter sp.]